MNGGFRRPPVIHPHTLREMALRAREAQGYGMPWPRENRIIPRQGDGNAYDEDGSDRLPPPGWQQNPDSAQLRGIMPANAEQACMRWGDTKELAITTNPLGAVSEKLSTYVASVDLIMPAAGLLRLSATSPDINALDAAWFVDWTIQTGVGSSMFDEVRRIQIAPANGTASTNISIPLPIQSLRITATAHVGPLATTPAHVHVNAQWAPYTPYPDLVRLISQQK